MDLGDFTSPDSIRLLMIVIFVAFLIFFVLYSAFAVYHSLRYGFKGDHLTIPVLVVYLAVSIVLIVSTFIGLRLS